MKQHKTLPMNLAPQGGSRLIKRRAGWQRAFHAKEFVPDEGSSAFLRQHPRPVGPGRPMADVLRMAAFQIGHPIVLRVLMKTHNAAGHSRT